jgi:hypothetical protein
LRSLRDHTTTSIQHDITWVDGLIADERRRLDDPGVDADVQEDTAT